MITKKHKSRMHNMKYGKVLTSGKMKNFASRSRRGWKKESPDGQLPIHTPAAPH